MSPWLIVALVIAIWGAFAALTVVLIGRLAQGRDEQIPTGRLDADR